MSILTVIRFVLEEVLHPLFVDIAQSGVPIVNPDSVCEGSSNHVTKNEHFDYKVPLMLRMKQSMKKHDGSTP